jgi:mutator protein MutT
LGISEGIFMKQKVVVRAIVRDSQGRTLFLRRKGGRPSISAKFELPGGKMIMGEQPVEALRRTLKYHTNLEAGTVQLFENLTYVDPEDRRIQYLFIIFMVGLAEKDNKIVLDPGYDKYIWKKKSDLQQNVVTESTKMIIGYDNNSLYSERHNNSQRFIIYSDGGSRGNPGPAAAGYIILDQNEDVVVDGGRYLGIQDSVYAEYAGMLLALIKAKNLNLKNVELRSDSLSAVNQINGTYKAPDELIDALFHRIKSLSKQFNSIRFIHIRRDFNQMADGIVNKILDKAEKSKS